MKGHVSINENIERHASCNCCESGIENVLLWDVRFTFHNHTTLVKLCREHLSQLKNESEKVSTRESS